MEKEIWKAAKMIAEWDGSDNFGNLRYKLVDVPRDAIDEDSDEPDAHMIVGIDDGGVRRVDILLDVAYGRELDLADKEILELAIEKAPSEAGRIIKQYF